MKNFCDRALADSQSIWDANFDHPFVQALAEGNLDIDIFKLYVIQDAYYLRSFGAVHALASYKAPDNHLAIQFAQGVIDTLQSELDLHASFIKDLEITQADLDAFIPSPNAYAYSNHMRVAGHDGDVAFILATLLPCYWLYLEIGKYLINHKGDNPFYNRWIDTYSSDWFEENVQEMKDLMNRLAENKSPEEIDALSLAFKQSVYYEYHFWDDAYRGLHWQV